MSYRETDGMRKIHQLAGHELGKIFAIDLVFNNAYGPDKSWFYDPKLSGGGCLLDLGVHLIDLALWVLNFPKVCHISSTLVSKGIIIRRNNLDTIEDYVSAQMETESGVLIRMACSWNLSAGQDAEISASFYGTEASALFYNVNGSFYDFETALCHGTSRQIISSPPEDWGGRAAIEWTKNLQESKLFNNSAFQYYETAEVIDKIYKRN
jgi:predicted dehydrogenase